MLASERLRTVYRRTTFVETVRFRLEVDFRPSNLLCNDVTWLKPSYIGSSWRTTSGTKKKKCRVNRCRVRHSQNAACRQLANMSVGVSYSFSHTGSADGRFDCRHWRPLSVCGYQTAQTSSNILRNVAQFFECAIDLENVTSAWRSLPNKHEQLSSVIEDNDACRTR